jgi:type I restriction enzyme S subunit
MEKMKKMVPELRFPGFSGEWVEKRLGQDISFLAGYAFDSKDMMTEPSNYQLLKMSNVYQNELRLDRNPSYLNVINDKQKDFLLQNGDTILTLTGTVGKQDYGYSVMIKENDKYLLNQRLVRLRGKKNNTANSFILFLVSNERFLYYFYTNSKGGTGNQSNVSIEDLKSLLLPLPTLPEQQKIASFLTAVDEKLQALKKKKDLLIQYKKGMMQKIFSQELRFKDKDGTEFPEWKTKSLGDLLDYEQPTKYLVESTEYDHSYKTPVLTAGKTFILGYTNEQQGIFENNLPVIIFDDFTTAIQFVDFPFKAKSSAMKILLPKKNENIYFIYQAMQLIEFAIGGHERHWISKYSLLEMPAPCYKEQTKIANFLSAIDEKINLCTTRIEKTEQYKKGLLQKMFV